jgi:hypothetical protein
MSDKRARRELERKIAELPEGRRIWDPLGTAVYQLEPTWATAVICFRCLYVGLMPTLPARALSWTCSQCGTVIRLEPPGEVLEAVRPLGELIVPPSRHARLS